MDQLKQWFEKHYDKNIADFFTFLRFASISADPAYKGEVRKAAQFLVSYLEKMGLESTLWETNGHPVVFASYSCEAGVNAPTLLLYNHYDVQPVDPLELWKTPPFEPEIRGGSVYARGAQDNKGQCFYTLLAIKAALEGSGKLPFNLKVFIEGEEESGGVATTEILQKREAELKADYLLLVDGGISRESQPEISMGTRGIVTMDLLCTTGTTDLHSGMHGGIALSANRVLCHILDSLWNRDGTIAIPYFYDTITPLPEEMRSRFYFEFDEETYLRESGTFGIVREKGMSPIEANLLHPSIEINGLSGGYTGSGFKTVIPKEARCKLSCRIVPGQDPDRVAEQIRSYLEKQLPEGAKLDCFLHHGAAAFRSSFNTPLLQIAVAAYEEVFGASCRLTLCGATIPITGDLAKASGAEALLIGLGLPEDQIHAPNESFGLDRLQRGFLIVSRIFEKFPKSL